MPDECPDKGHCPEHDDNTATINRHKGMWTIVLVILGLSLSGGWYFLDRIDRNVQSIFESTTKMDKVFTRYMAANTQKLNEINHRIASCEKTGDDHENRLRALEHAE